MLVRCNLLPRLLHKAMLGRLHKKTLDVLDKISHAMELSDEEYRPVEMSVNSLNKTAQGLGCTAIKTFVSHRDKLSYGKRKVKQLHTTVKAKCADALDLPIGEFESTDSDIETCRDLQRLIALLREKLKTATRQQKIKLLTLHQKIAHSRRQCRNVVLKP